ncbi:MmcQ/YjbR family DNA-binding protein [Corynebacterium vitaeruminis]|uniref:MmcQ-like protein n=1 Tax=Corynebacterium vitaeruminis DSM 20294 TaxID=1224164 RepID=W5Y378_9CORY|nr:MmcQ/YjbR family DNA-binding protein [Corynebacterium vitaeruminis]AHI23711.1 hypothetical protein B843_11675 [Corynebacterium vitaeruminis DSM 20294]
MDLFRIAGEHALELPATELTHPFGAGWDVYRVKDKMFCVLSHPEENPQRVPMVIVKAIPEEGERLRARYAEITPGYHMNKVHWNSIVDGPGISENLVRDLITDSYLAVVAGLPRAKRPVDPENHGLRQFGAGF